MKLFPIAFIVFFNTTVVLGQSFDISHLDNRNNLNDLNLHWATAKLCKKYYEENDLLTAQQNKSTFTLPGGRSDYGCSVCVELLKNRHHSYFEYFAHRFLNDKRIQKNRTNVFTVNALRKEIAEKYLDSYNQSVNAVDTENMVFYQYDLITGYNVEMKELYIKMFYPHIKKIAYGTNGNLINAPHLERSLGTNGHPRGGLDLGTFKISMSEEQAQKIYGRYKNHFRPNPPFGVATKLHYAIRMAKEQNGQVRNFEIILKKAEFFLPLEEDIKRIQSKTVKIADMQENIFAEIIFDSEPTHTQLGYLTQKIKSTKAF
ncbi:hypothetical protein DKG77_11720 [Flagellimonas aquimarina]|uniref:Uncharacterized protein n=1 Tax=Flagellimonas aquimarina TaxID=2201895 RepID=A0A316KZ50_9FLAO|nr:hypothetical protein [Allomuricauda koreensis]PWL38896.1 hypothetical protein DKG77_11720 [Allomuricauda koreensis]